MRIFFGTLLLATAFSLAARAQTVPAEGKTLNYRLIGFTESVQQAGSAYHLQIAAGTTDNEDTFSKNIIHAAYSKNNKIVAEVPAFGKAYTWRMLRDGKPGALHHFSTGWVNRLDTAKFRIHVVKSAETSTDAYFFLDGNKLMSDMKGRPVWYLPDIEGENVEIAEMHDMKLTPQGTITFIMGERALEVDVDGKILWSAPDDGRISHEKEEHYHHEFTRLANGNYMVLGTEYAAAKLPKVNNAAATSIADNKVRNNATNFVYQKLLAFGTIIEYNPKGEIVWSWKASPYFKDLEVGYPLKLNGIQENVIHENAFFFDARQKNVLVSFKNISQVMKIHYPDGKLMDSWGALNKENVVNWTSSPFCEQHACKRTASGELLLFNNNLCLGKGIPKLMRFKEPATRGALKKTWEYQMPEGSLSERIPGKEHTTSGGNVTEVKNGVYFASMCSPFGNVFMVNEAGTLLFNCIPEKWSARDEKWIPVAQYRASYASPKDLERLLLPKP
jgi:hypothetical protein